MFKIVQDVQGLNTIDILNEEKLTKHMGKLFTIKMFHTATVYKCLHNV